MRAAIVSVQTALAIALTGLAALLGAETATAQSLTPPGEGLYRPDAVAVPPPVDEAVAGVVRLQANLRFRVALYAESDSADAARKRLRSRPNRGKEFRADGEVIWPVALDTTQIRSTCENPVASASPGLYDICRAWRDHRCEEYPCRFTTQRIAGASTGFAVAPRRDGSIWIGTAYHVAREAIERHGRTGGRTAPDPVAIDVLTAQVCTGEARGAASCDRAGDLRLVAHASEQDWKQGLDWALLSVPQEEAPASLDPLPVADTRPQPGDTLWAVGFPFRTRRDLPASAGYTNAAGDLRISIGRVVDADTVSSGEVQPTDIVTTLDGVSGNSGSPVLNRKGEVVGIFRTTTVKSGDVDPRVAQYAGYSLVAPIAPIRDVLRTRE